MISDEIREKMAIAYANAWAADIRKYLKLDAPNWDEVGPAAQKATRRVSASVLSTILPMIVEKCAEVAEIPVVKGTILRATFEESQPFVLAAWKCGVEDCGRDVAGAIRSLARP